MQGAGESGEDGSCCRSWIVRAVMVVSCEVGVCGVFVGGIWSGGLLVESTGRLRESIELYRRSSIRVVCVVFTIQNIFVFEVVCIGMECNLDGCGRETANPKLYCCTEHKEKDNE